PSPPALDLAPARRHEHVQGAADVGREIVARVLRAGDDVPGREVEDERGGRNERVHELDVRHRAPDDPGTGRDRLRLAGEQVVEDGHACARIHELAGEGATDEPRAAGDEDPTASERALGRGHHRLTPVRSRTAGRNSRHQSLRPRIFVYPSLAWYTTVQGCSITR